jgi:hypothetical protein
MSKEGTKDPAVTNDDETPTPALVTTAASAPDIDHALIVNGQINIRKTHPNLYRIVMTFAILNIALGLNFWVLSPTFQIFNLPNSLWGTIFLVLGSAKLVFLNICRRLRLVRACVATAIAFMFFLGAGTMQPFFEGDGSLQLPILYFGCALLQFPMLVEPFLNPWTAKRDV